MTTVAASKPQTTVGPVSGSRCLRCGAPLLDVLGHPPYLLYICKCSSFRGWPA